MNPSNRVGRMAASVGRLKLPSSSIPSSSSSRLPRLLPNATPRRSIFGFGRKPKESIDDNPIYTEYLKRKPRAPPTPVSGDISKESIFGDEVTAPGPDGPSRKGPRQAPPRNPEAMAVVLDPQPGVRKRWERKMVMREIRNQGRVSRDIQIKRTERENTSRGHFFKTSTKKLSPLARQITGKPIDEAIVQMRFSKKKAAKTVKEHLEHAKNEAIVRRGMGLGTQARTKGDPVEIETKDGKRMTIPDRSRIYVDQAWVGRGSYTPEPEYRAKGQVNILRHPQTSISVLLKEEATRIRQHNEREEKRRRRKVWQHLPNRPVTAQRPYYCW